MEEGPSTRIALEAARQTGLPVWVGYSCVTTADGDLKLFDARHALNDSVRDISRHEADVVSIMHTLTEETTAALRIVQQHWTGALGAYAYSGAFVMPNWQFINLIMPERIGKSKRILAPSPSECNPGKRACGLSASPAGGRCWLVAPTASPACSGSTP